MAVSGAGGSASVTVSSGGTLDVFDTLRVYSGNPLLIDGGNAFFRGDVVVDDPADFSFALGFLSLGADLTIDSGGLLGSDLALETGRELIVGGTTTIGISRNLSVNGTRFSTGTLVNNGSFDFISGTFALTDADLTVGSTGLFGSALELVGGQDIAVTNNVNVDVGAVLSLAGGAISAGQFVNNGIIDVSSVVSSLDGGGLSNSGLVQGDGVVAAPLTNLAGGEVRISAGEQLSFSGMGNSSAGEIRLLGGTLEFEQDLVNTAGGEINGRGVLIASGGLDNQGNATFSGGATDVFGDVDHAGSIRISGNSTLTFYDDFVNDGTEFRISVGSLAVFFGDYSGSGGIQGLGTALFDGTTNGGSSPGLVTSDGTVIFGEGNRLVIELAGLTPGEEFDRWLIDGEAYLGGTLEIRLVDGFMPQQGDLFGFLSAEGGLLGSFDTILLPDLGPMSFNLLTGVNALQLRAVPLPASLWMLLSALGALGVRGARIAVAARA